MIYGNGLWKCPSEVHDIDMSIEVHDIEYTPSVEHDYENVHLKYMIYEYTHLKNMIYESHLKYLIYGNGLWKCPSEVHDI